MYRHNHRSRQNNRFRPRNGGGGRGGFRIKTFDPSHVVNASLEVVQEISEPKHAFSDFAISEKLKSNVNRHG